MYKPTLRFVLRLRLQKGGPICGTLWYRLLIKLTLQYCMFVPDQDWKIKLCLCDIQAQLGSTNPGQHLHSYLVGNPGKRC